MAGILTPFFSLGPESEKGSSKYYGTFERSSECDVNRKSGGVSGVAALLRIRCGVRGEFAQTYRRKTPLRLIHVLPSDALLRRCCGGLVSLAIHISGYETWLSARAFVCPCALNLVPFLIPPFCTHWIIYTTELTFVQRTTSLFSSVAKEQ